jgi:carbohydrate diacid regulator
MELNELTAENIVNKLSALLKRKVSVADENGAVLASTDLSETDKNYEQLRKVVESKSEVETSGPATKISLPQGLIVPISHGEQVIGTLFIEDKPEEYQYYRAIVSTMVELLINQNVMIDSFPYKDKIKDNFVFGLLHRQLSVEDNKVREEAELFDINLNRDKVVMIIMVEGFWDGLFGQNITATEEQKQTALSDYKKRIYQAAGQFFGRLSGCSVSYFGLDTFVVLLDELYSLDGRAMIDQIRTKSTELHKLLEKQFEESAHKRLLTGVGSFYRGKDGAILAYEEAKRAINLGLSIGDVRDLYHIDDLGMVATLAGGNKKWQDNFVRRLLVKLSQEDYLLQTVESFFDKNMSLTQTSKQLGIHRNTLLYRLDKIKKVTGLDPRKFNEAMELKVALILNRVLNLEKATAKAV